MLVVHDFPPIFGRIALEFPEATRREVGAIFCWGRVIFNPHRGKVTAELQAHEIVHCHQQLGPQPKVGVLTEADSVAEDQAIRGWWKRYIEDVPFRMSQEIPAYHAQYVAHRRRKGVVKGATYLEGLARELAGPLYGRVIEYREAYEAIVIGSRAREGF